MEPVLHPTDEHKIKTLLQDHYLRGSSSLDAIKAAVNTLLDDGKSFKEITRIMANVHKEINNDADSARIILGN